MAPQCTERRICVCVDDFGLHDGINQAALELAARKRIAAVSCLVDGQAWPRGWDALRRSAVSIEVGLHLNFTEDLGQPGPVHSLATLLSLTCIRGLSKPEIKQQIQRQCERFESTTGRMPDFVDGHQHVHQLPLIREALIEVLDARYGTAKPWLRATRPPRPGWASSAPLAVKFKSRLIGLLGATALAHLAARHGYRQNRHLLGVYGFDQPEQGYLDNMRRWLRDARDGDVLMCHPSLNGPWSDPMLVARCTEYRVLSGDAFGLLAAREQIKISALSVCL
jgi:predicted glycoside hydrolase/deacetylase ChbG (UPF0249 family)